MSKATIALICTWVLLALIGAFFGGYFWAKKKVCKTNDQNAGNVIINNEKANNTVSSPVATPSISATPNIGSQTVTQPSGASTTSATGANNIVQPAP